VLGVGAAVAPPVHADEWDKKTIVTFSASVEVPGTVLPAGKYVFKLVDSPADRHIVRIMNERENKVFATVLAIPAYRMEPRGHSVFTFYEMPVGQPEALKKWYYPGDNYGQEFAYSKKRAAEIALAQKELGTKTTEQAVVATVTPAPSANETGEIAATALVPPAEEPTPAVTETTDNDKATDNDKDNAEPAVAPEPEPQAPAPAPAPAAPAPTDNDLPKTASDLYLVGLLGVLATLGAVSVRQYRRS